MEARVARRGAGNEGPRSADEAGVTLGKEVGRHALRNADRLFRP
ncbi:hypothetical protein [Streptomyces sp. KS 21]|nr:hypothetical protein [Streptomyces sp. KS 21]